MRTARTLAALALVGAASAVSAGAAPSGAVREGGTFRVAFPAYVLSSIDPHVAPLELFDDAVCASLLHQRDEPLPAGRDLAPELATGFPRVSNGGRAYTFVVRRGFRFSTGAAVTARDVAASFRRVLRYESDYWMVVGARDFAKGRASTVRGLSVKGNRVTFRLTTPRPDFAGLVGQLCVLPAGLPSPPEGARAPLPTAGPYYIASYVPGRRLILMRNRFYGGSRPHHVDRFEIALVDDTTRLVDAIERGTYDYADLENSELSPDIPRLRARYGVNRQRFFVRPGRGVFMLVLNNSRGLFGNNPRLRRAVNFAIDRRAFAGATGPLLGTPTDQYLVPFQHAFRNANIYPAHPDVKQARKLAKGHVRGGKAVFYARDNPLGRALGEIVRSNLAKIGLEVEVKPVPQALTFDLLRERGEPWDIGSVGFQNMTPDDLTLHWFFDGRTLGQPDQLNYSRFDAPAINRRLDEVSRLRGRAFNRAYGKLDIELARDYAPAVPILYPSRSTFVSARTGCVITRPGLDLAAVCLRG